MDIVDVVVIGAGPAGCVCALSFAQQGARVVVLEAMPAVTRRLAGEWIQPAGVQVLRRLGVDLLTETRGSLGHGFVVHPSDGSGPIRLPYPEGNAWCMSHDRLTEALRRVVAEHPGIDLRCGTRAQTIGPSGTVRTPDGALRGSLIVGADGRSSVVRAHLTSGREDRHPAVRLSHMAGLVLDDVALPVEQYGHILLGGAGPVLAYRMDDRTVRLCLDVPRTGRRGRDMQRFLWENYVQAIPQPLHQPMATQLERGRVRWAANHFRRRTLYGSGRYALIGDAVGQAHPLVASGLTSAFLDAECLAHSVNVAAYARERSAPSWTSDRLGAGIHRLFSENTPATGALRQAVFAMWRKDAHKRARTLRLLAMTESSQRALLAAFLDVLGAALSSRVRHAARTGQDCSPAQEISGLLAWLGWLCGPHVGIPRAPKDEHG